MAVELTHYEKPNLIILDVKLPDKDGYFVFEELKTYIEATSIPVIYYFALKHVKVGEEATKLGADGFVSKSAGSEELLAKVRGALGELESRSIKQK